MDRATPRLLNHLPRYFDPGAAPILALRVRHPLGFAWRVAGRVLEASTETGAAIGAYTLTAMTLSELADALIADGCQVLHEESGHLQADVLIDGENAESRSNGDHLYAYTSPTWAILDAYAGEVEAAEAAIAQVEQDAHLDTAEDEFLDIWGSYFGVPRATVQLMRLYRWDAGSTWGARSWGSYRERLSDADYSAAIVRETIRPRGNPFAIEQAVCENTGIECRIREPWQDVARFDDSQSDDRWHFYDANFWTWNVIQPIWYGYPSLSDVARALAVIERNRPLGTVVVHPGETPAPVGVTVAGVLVGSAAMRAWFALPTIYYGATDCTVAVSVGLDVPVAYYGATDCAAAMFAGQAIQPLAFGQADAVAGMAADMGVPVAYYGATDCAAATSAGFDLPVLPYGLTDGSVAMAADMDVHVSVYGATDGAAGMDMALAAVLPYGATDGAEASSANLDLVMAVDRVRPRTWAQMGTWVEGSTWGVYDFMTIKMSES